MASTALKTSLKSDLIDMIKSSITGSNRYYFFVARAVPYTDDPTTTTVLEGDVNPPLMDESSRNIYNTLRNTIFLKRIQAENMRVVIPRYDWSSGTAYVPYSETTDMVGKTFYVMTSEYNVYKCLGAVGNSTIMPTGKSSMPVKLADGYTWKYIYTVPEDYLGFITLEYIPVFVGNEDFPDQLLVEATAKPGSIDSVSFTSSYSPTFSKAFSINRPCTNIGSFNADTGKTANIAGSSYITFDVAGEVSNPGNSYWNNYGLHVVGGSGAGQYFRILNFVKGGNAGASYYYANVYPNISRELSSLTSTVKVVPYIAVDGDGTDAVIVPTVSSTKKITALNITHPGINYTYAQPRVVTESESVAIGSQISQFNDAISASLSIPKGHGFNALKEFGAVYLMIAMDVESTEAGKITARNDYRQFGIIKNPLLQGGLTLAGDEEQVSLKALLKKEPNKLDGYAPNRFASGNYIIGKETNAVAKILGSERIAGSKFYRLFLTDVNGQFRFADNNSLKTRVYFSTAFSPTSPFATGENAYQYEGNNNLVLTAKGKVLSFDMTERTLLLDTTYGAFSPSLNIGFDTATTLTSSDIVDLDQDYGEMVGQFKKGTTFGSLFLTFGGDENFGRLASTSFVPVQIDDVGEYSATTKIQIQSSSSPYTDKIISSSNATDGKIIQTDSTTLKKTTADVMDFYVVGGSGLTGTLYLSNVTGSFNTTDPLYFSSYGVTAENLISNTTINFIQKPEVAVGSGELLYIENVRPIERNVEQSEEFKIVIGF